ncbi:MAG: TonB-dependent receptor plug domain-containing protein [Lautropia sp.]|nr:TonB-dependent receptor plug domain-containing protein [Lautropia sp.]
MKPWALMLSALLLPALTPAEAQTRAEAQTTGRAAPDQARNTFQLPSINIQAPVWVEPGDRQATDAQLGASHSDARRLSRRRASSPDSSSLLKDMPGVEILGAGGVSGLPVIHGLGDERLRLTVDDMDLMAACANHMNPVLSYIDPAKVEQIKVHAGLSPVSAGGDSIGGSIQVSSALPVFADPGEDPLTEGNVSANYRRNGDGFDLNAAASHATSQWHLRYNASYARAGNYRAGGVFKAAGAGREQGRIIPGDEVTSTSFETQNHQLGLAWRAEKHLLETQLNWQDMPFQGFPNQRMDMTQNRALLSSLRYLGQFSWGDLKARTWHQRIRHQMDMGDDRHSYGTGMPMHTSASTTGVAVAAHWLLSERHTIRLGTDALRYTLYDWWPPVGASGVMAPNNFWNIDYGRRNKLSAFAEWEAQWQPAWLGLIGIRHTRIHSDAGPVQGYSQQPTWAEDARLFNASPRSQHDRHWDLSAMLSHTPAEGRRYEMGVARKTRSTSLYERYPWSTNTMAAGMNNFLGDGNGYLGNPTLKPEVAHTVSLVGQWDDTGEAPRWRIRLHAHVSQVKDYIDAERCPAERCRSGNQSATDEFVLLRYVNQDARLYGADLSGHWQPFDHAERGSLRLNGALSWLRGTNRTTGNGLYNMMPANLKLGLEHQIDLDQGRLHTTLEWQGVQAKERRSSVRNEIRTPGYALLHLRLRYELKQLSLDLGVENLLDRHHALPLGGAYVGQGSSMMLNTVPWGIAVPGHGRNLYAGFSYRF